MLFPQALGITVAGPIPTAEAESNWILIFTIGPQNFSCFNCGVTSDDVTLEKACQMGSIVTDDFYDYSCCHTIKLKRVLISWEQKTNLIQYFL